MKRNIFRVLLRSISFTTALFIFQACYGSPQDFGLDLHVDGKVLAKSSGLPIKGIRVSVLNNVQYVFTDEQGRFSLYTEKNDKITLAFEDIDAGENGRFIKKDTTLTTPPDRISFNIILEEQQ